MISVPASFFIFALLLLRLPPFHARFRFIENAIFHRIFQGRVISLGRSGFTGNPVFSGSQICEAKWTKFPVSALTDNLFPVHRLRDGRAIGLESLLF